MEGTGKYILNDAGEPEVCHDVLKWGAWFEDSAEQRVVARDTIGDVVVVTFFTALDYRFRDDGAPLLWQTDVVGAPDESGGRYTSVENARKGHDDLVAALRAAHT